MNRFRERYNVILVWMREMRKGNNKTQRIREMCDCDCRVSEDDDACVNKKQSKLKMKKRKEGWMRVLIDFKQE